MKVILWQPSPFLEQIDFDNQKILKITTRNEFRLLQKQIGEVKLLIVLAELVWDTDYTSFSGFSYIEELRINGATFPVIICSFMPEKWFLESDIKRSFDIIRTPGHYFRQLPVSLKQLFNENLPSIDKATLKDINQHIFSLRGYIEEVFHKTKNIIHQQSIDPIALSDSLVNAFNRTGPIINYRKKIEFDMLKEKLFSSLFGGQQNINVSETRNLTNLTIARLKSLVDKMEPPLLKDDDLQYNWQVLYLEDDSALGDQMKNKFKNKGIDCITANSPKEAYRILATDEDDKIAVLLTDYRLLDENDYWYEDQGYHVIKKVNQDFPNRYLSFFALSSFHEASLLHIQQEYNIRVWSYQKSDVINKDSESGFNIFARKVIEEAEQKIQHICDKQTTRVWKDGDKHKFDKSFSYYYQQHRIALDFQQANRRIGFEAGQQVLYFMSFEANYKGVERPKIEHYSYQKGIGKNKGSDTKLDDKIEQFRTKLIGRRVAIALKVLFDFTAGEIYSKMKSYSKGRAEEGNKANQFLTLYLGISLKKDIPSALFPEEMIWLDKLKTKLKELPG